LVFLQSTGKRIISRPCHLHREGEPLTCLSFGILRALEVDDAPVSRPAMVLELLPPVAICPRPTYAGRVQRVALVFRSTPGVGAISDYHRFCRQPLSLTY